MADYKDLPSSIKKNITEKAWGDLSEDTRKSLGKGLKSMTKNFASNLQNRVGAGEEDRINISDSENLGGISDTLGAIAQRGEVATKALRQMAQAGAFFFVDGPAAQGLDQVIASLDKQVGSAELGAQAYGRLSRTMQGFNLLNQKLGKGTKMFTAELSEQAGILSQLGMSFSAFQANADLAIYSLGMNAEEVKKFNFSIKSLSKDLNMLPDEVSRNFQLVAKNMAYDTDKIRDQFVKFQTMSQKTGLNIETLTQQFGGRMDTISGASSAAANINTLLGRNQFSATELLMMDDADRAKSIREAVMGDKNIMGDIEAGGAQGKFALRSVAESLGMDVDQARRFIKTGEVKDAIGDTVDKNLGKDLDSAKVTQFTKGTVSMTEAMEEASKEIMRLVGPMRAALLGQRRKFLEDMESGKADSLSMAELGLTARLGIIPGQGSVKQVARAMAIQPGAQDTIKRLVEASQMGVIEPKRLQEILEKLNAADPETRQGGLAEARKLADVDFANMMSDKDKLPAPLISVLTRLPSYAARILYREAMALGKDKVVDSDGSFTTDFQKIIDKVKGFQSTRSAMAANLRSGKIAAARANQTSLNLKNATAVTAEPGSDSGIEILQEQEARERQIQKDSRMKAETQVSPGTPTNLKPGADFQEVRIYLSETDKIPLTRLIVNHVDRRIGRATE